MANTKLVYGTNNAYLTTASSSLSSLRVLRLHVDLDNYVSLSVGSPTVIAVLALLLHLVLSRKRGGHLSEQSAHVVSALGGSLNEQNAELLRQSRALVRGHLSMGEGEETRGPRVGEIRLVSNEDDHDVVASLAADII